MNAIYLDAAMVPATLRGNYNGKKFKAVVVDTVTVPADAGLWSDGSRDHWRGVNVNTGEAMAFPGQQSAPWDKRQDCAVTLIPGFAVVRHSMSCGVDMGLTFYVHPDNAAKLLPAPQAELSAFEKIVLNATKSLKSSYGGKDRYTMSLDGRRYGPEANEPFPTRAQWDETKLALIGRGLLNKASAITTAGRNAI